MSQEMRQLVDRMNQLKMKKARLLKVEASQEYPVDYENNISMVKDEIRILSDDLADIQMRYEKELQNAEPLIRMAENIDISLRKVEDEYSDIEVSTDATNALFDVQDAAKMLSNRLVQYTGKLKADLFLLQNR
jgi:hypothetical protein